MTIWDGENDVAYPGEVLIEGNRIKAVARARNEIAAERASDIIDGDIAQASNEAGPFGPGTVGRQEQDARRDLIWCREQLRSLLSVKGQPVTQSEPSTLDKMADEVGC